MLRFILLISIYFCSFSATCQECLQPLTLSLSEAIYLSIRENPSVQQAVLNEVQQKFSLSVARWQFQPHFNITGIAQVGNGVTNNQYSSGKNIGLQPTATLLTPIGTQLSLLSTNTVTHNYNPGLSLQIVQPLIRGFGRAVVESALYNAIDSERISRLNIENALRTTITNVILAYLDAVSAENTIKIDMEALKRAEISVTQTELFIKAGRKAPVELVTVQADVANAKTKLETDKNNVEQMHHALLTAIGIDPCTPIILSSIDILELIHKYQIPSLEETKCLTLNNDIQYQIDQITLHGATQRGLVLAEDNARWQLNFTANAAVGNGTGGGLNSGWSCLVNGANRNQSVQLNLSIPIDDRNAKQAIVSAKIALREAQIALKQEKWHKETLAINSWNTIYNTERALHFSEQAERLQYKTYQLSFQKYQHGLIDSLELQSAHQQLITRQQTLLESRINYLKALATLDSQLGKTLQTWKVGTRYS